MYKYLNILLLFCSLNQIALAFINHNIDNYYHSTLFTAFNCTDKTTNQNDKFK